MFIMELFAAHPYLTIIALAAFAYLIGSIRVANQYERSVVFRLGKFNRTAGPGLYLVWLFLEWQTKLDLRTITANVEQQEGITRDNVPIKVDAVVWYRIVDPERAVIEVKAVSNAVVQVSLTTLRAVLGQHTLDEILKAQDTIAEVMQKSIDSITEPWGVKVELVQMKNVEIPPSMQRAMAQEAEALREKRARLIKAEAELDAAEQLRQAAEVIMQNPAGLELRRMQMITEVGAEQNTMTIIMMPSEFVAMARGIADAAKVVASKG
ncbi:slipin family protein [Bradyrhizobium sp. Bra64]|uniref:slipin family protein n=1 Tax=Bradyrhizobium sp. Bra64 TaxID=2926009 RepID=UPI002119413F|nr:slipin family protein [Bradyrhizobium sp. Bra64]